MCVWSVSAFPWAKADWIYFLERFDGCNRASPVFFLKVVRNFNGKPPPSIKTTILYLKTKKDCSKDPRNDVVTMTLFGCMKQIFVTRISSSPHILRRDELKDVLDTTAGSRHLVMIKIFSSADLILNCSH